jgi:hypothetical protein
MPGRGFYLDFHDEVSNSAEIHKPLVSEIEALTGRAFIAYVASPAPGHPGAALLPLDIESIEGIMQGLKLDRKTHDLDFMIESPGGTLDAAERLVRVCRAYSRNFRTIVVGQAMSAATLFCLGSDELLMGETSNIGPIDPQMVYQTKDGQFMRPAKSIIDAFSQAVSAAQEAIRNNQPADPFLHILDRLDVSFVIDSLRAREATKRVGSDLLTTGLMKNAPPKDIQVVVEELMKVGDESYHGRPFWHETARKQGLSVNVLPPQDALWTKCWQLQIRMKNYAMTRQLAKYMVCRSGGLEQRVQIVQVGG